jgi:4-amino-4-deoxy-L-arabinose transferase-like glycosyltransferase
VLVGTVALLLATTSDLGYARDEGFYFYASRVYGDWFELLWNDPRAAMRRDAVDAAFRVNSEHPALAKSLFALSDRLLGQKLGWFDEAGTAFRFPAMLLAGSAAALIYAWVAGLGTRLSGLVAALLFVFMPRLFYHAHLACFDAPIAAMFLFVVAAYARSLSRGGALAALTTGLLFGLALDTKHNAWFLPFLFAAHLGLLAAWSRFAKQAVLPRVEDGLRSLLAMALVGPAVLVLAWPWLWHQGLERWWQYARFHLEHEYYNMEFFGETWWRPPFPRLYAPFMTLATVPTITLLLAATGAAVRARGAWRELRAGEGPSEASSTTLLFFGAIAISYAPWLSSSTPIFGGTKHWIQAYPFLAMLAGLGFARLELALRARFAAPLAPALALRLAALVLVVAAPIVETLRAHPFALSHYVPLVGGARGGASLGLNRGFWGYTTGSLVAWLDRETPRGGRVYPHDTALESWKMLVEDGRLRADIEPVRFLHDADIALYHHEMHMQGEEYQAWVAYETVRPVVIEGIDGVPVVWVYRRAPRDRAR